MKEVPGGRVGRPQKYPTHLWFTTPTGRGERLKPVQVSVRIRSELPLTLKKEVTTMNATILSIENRINLLRNRDPVGNAAIIKKLERRLRKLQNG